MMFALVPALCVVIGLLCYVISDKPKLIHLGDVFFCVGLFWLVYFLSGKTIHLG